MTAHDDDIGDAERQWMTDHPEGISPEEEAAMVRYAIEACREEGCHDR